MHDEPSPLTPEPAVTSPPPPGPRLWELGVWVALVTIALALFILTLAAPAGETPDDPGGRLEIRLQGRYAVGVDALFGTLGESFAENLSGPLLEQIRDLAESDAERLLMVPVVAELASAEEALEEIAGLRREGGLTAEAEADLEVLRTIYGSGGTVSAERLEGFRERRGWFARLALSHGQDADDPERQAVLAEAKRLAALMVALVGGVALGGAVGLVLLVLGFLLHRQGKLRGAYTPHRQAEPPARRVPYLETVVVFILATIGVSVVAGLFVGADGGGVWALGVVLLALPAVFWPLLRGVSTPEMRHAYGWHAGTGVWREIAWGLVGYVAGAPLLIAGILVSVLLTVWIEQPPHHPIMDSITGAGWAGIVLIYVVACVSAPLAEETVFRGGFYHYLRGHLGVAASAFVVSVFFAIIHPQGLLGIPPLIALAMILALIREWRGSLVGPIAVHAVHNALATTVLLLLFG